MLLLMDNAIQTLGTCLLVRPSANPNPLAFPASRHGSPRDISLGSGGDVFNRCTAAELRGTLAAEQMAATKGSAAAVGSSKEVPKGSEGDVCEVLLL